MPVWAIAERSFPATPCASGGATHICRRAGTQQAFAARRLALWSAVKRGKVPFQTPPQANPCWPLKQDRGEPPHQVPDIGHLPLSPRIILTPRRFNPAAMARSFTCPCPRDIRHHQRQPYRELLRIRADCLPEDHSAPAGAW